MQALLSMLLKSLWAVLGSWAAKLAGEKFLQWALLEIAQCVVDSTKTKADDKWLAKIRKTVMEGYEDGK